eukprot:CAMPEP_0195028070 /NCGR_PEP_ID=MMETSP0326_2-20130528/53656_1 /TAXON_ID=2866 ORGANISM="Crypthecodinium cohnii, Strain Seligo" /NCGR_SAMPLE_ID=MMETSP0326_2 /ASSEMBLY_ACC=CAM_ASM_000348 /LENGTH=36 /DNA_ID= /DNA_START= /DNA_END= /DNA_ORIENTATION=
MKLVVAVGQAPGAISFADVVQADGTLVSRSCVNMAG